MMPSLFYKPVMGPFFGAITILSWAGFNVAAKAGIDAGMSPAALSFLRYLTPGVVAIPLLIWLRCRANAFRLPIYKLAVLAVLGGPLFGLIAVAGYQFAPLSYGLLFAPVAVFICGTLLGILLLKEQVSAPRVLGAFIMFGGLALLVGIETTGASDNWFFGVGLFVTAGTMWGAYTVLLRHWQIPVLEGTSTIASIGATLTAIALAPFAWPSLSEIELPMLLTQIAMQGFVGGILSVVALVIALQHLSAQTVALLPTFTPAVAMMIAWMALGTKPETMEIIGAKVIFLGFTLAARKKLVFAIRPAQHLVN
ncbi:DMT family transporter [Roseobacter sp.]|uniref:DMT family transporter n=1 Tax=Roseobacter sp. TaxID=1907202 RepID=UPI0029674084|nr:DMT family transporter [Roseobacter sp.]MDW3182738.1 DMT family transporter [Roseobacter sp.]